MRQGLRQALNLRFVPSVCIRRCEQHVQISGQNGEAGMLPAAQPTAGIATAATTSLTAVAFSIVSSSATSSAAAQSV